MNPQIYLELHNHPTMKFTVSTLIDQLSHVNSIESKKLEKILKLSKKADRQKLHIALSALNKLGIVDRDDSDQISLTKENSFIEARLRCTSKGYCFAVRNDIEEDVYIRDSQLNHAWNGDRVLIKITREGFRRRSPEGAVQCILERTTSSVLAHIEKVDHNIVALPLDERFLTSVVLPDSDSKFLEDESNSDVYEIKIDKYPIAQCPTEGHVVRSIPLNGGYQSDTDLLITKANLQDLPKAPKSSLKIPDQKNRHDLTEQQCLLLNSWQEENSPPIPCVYVEPNSGGIKLWIHSPSIAERLTLGNNLDLWIRDRCEALCLGKSWLPFLSNSLKKNSEFKVDEENDAISVSIDIDSKGNITDWQFCLSKIKPSAQITPEMLSAIVDRKPKARTIPLILKPIKQHINHIETIIFSCKLIHKNLVDQGFIELDLPVPDLDQIGDLKWETPGGSLHQWIPPINLRDPQSLLSMLVKIADIAWTQHSKKLQLPSLLIKSDQPDLNTITEIAKIALAIDIKLELNEEGTPTAHELAKEFAQTQFRRILDQQLSNALPNPVVSSNKIEHSIAMEPDSKASTNLILAPCSCPGQSYVQLFNQFVLALLLNSGKDRPSARAKTKVNLGKNNSWNEINWPIFTQTIVDNLNKVVNSALVNQLNNSKIKRNILRQEIISLCQSRVAESLIGTELEGNISGVQSYGFFAEIPASMVEGLVHVSSLNDDWYEYRSRQNRLVGRKNRKVYKLGDPVTLKIMKVNVLRNQIDLEVVENVNEVSSNNEESANYQRETEEIQPENVNEEA